MIKIEILEADDSLLIGIYEFKFNSLFIGKSKKSDIILLDSDLPPKFLEIKFVGNKLVVQNESGSPFYFVNNKKMSGLRTLNIDDIISFGKNRFKILSAKETKLENTEHDLSYYYEHLQKNNPELKFMLDFLEEEIINLENKDV